MCRRRRVKPVALKARFVFRLTFFLLTFLVLWGCLGNKLLGLNTSLVGLVECLDNLYFDLFPCIYGVAFGKHSFGFSSGLFTYLFLSHVRL